MPDEADRSKQPGSLEYERGTNPYISGRRYRVLLGLTLLNTLMLAGLIAAPYVMPFAREKWRQWQVARAQEKERQRILAFEQKCLDHADPPGKVEYEEDPAEAATLLATPGGGYWPAVRGVESLEERMLRRRRFGPVVTRAPTVPPGFQPPVRVVPPDYLREFDEFAGRYGGGRGGGGLFAGPSPDDASDPPLLFLHQRTTPAGERLLVDVRLYPGFGIGSRRTTDASGQSAIYHVSKHRRLVATAWTLPAAPDPPQRNAQTTVLLVLPDMAGREFGRAPLSPEDADGAERPATKPAPIDYGNRLRVFAGQADPNVPSRFTIGYAVDGRAGTFEGTVRNDGIVLRPREGARLGAQQVIDANGGTLSVPYDLAWDLAAPATTRPAQ